MKRYSLAGLVAASLLLVGGLGAEELDAPISMADPNGQDLVLEDLDVRLAVHGPLALTELEMRFRNPQNRQVEGRFACNLPPGATVSRFAKEVGGKLMEGEVVERLKAKRVYTEILHTMRDPALLEQDQGNRFQARIFPIPARSQVRLLLSYSRVYPVGADGTRSISVPLRGLQEIGRFGFRGVVRTLPGEVVTAAGWLGQATRKQVGAQVLFSDAASWEDFTPDQDLTLLFAPEEGAPRENLVRAGDFRMVTYRPSLPGRSGVETPDEWVFYVDTSASAAPSAEVRLKALREVFDELGRVQPGVSVHVYAFDLDVAPVGAFTAGRSGVDEIMDKLAARHQLGATSLEKLVAHLGEKARKGRKQRHFVLASDVVPSLDEREAGTLARKLGGWPAGNHLHVLQLGSLIEERVSKALAEHGRGRVVALPLTATYAEKAKQAVANLRRTVGVSFQVKSEGADWVQPDFFEDVQDGAELVAFVKGGSASVSFERLGKGSHEVAAGEVEVAEFAPLLERLAYKAYLGHLERRAGQSTDAREKQRLVAEQLEISLEHRVLCPLTSMLVLETERDYRRFEIDRRALVDIMKIGEKGIELWKRAEPVKPEPVKRPRPTLVRDFRNKDKWEEKAVMSKRKVARPRAPMADDDDSFGDDGLVEPMEESESLAGEDLGGAELDAVTETAASAPRRRAMRAPQAMRAPRASANSLQFESRLEGRGGPGGSGSGGGSGRSYSDARGAPPPPAPEPAMAPPASRVAGLAAGDAMAADEEPLMEDQAFSDPADSGERQDMDRSREISGFVGQISSRRPRPRPAGGVSRPPPQPAKRSAPSWVSQATWRPGKDLLQRLRREVSRNPRDRQPRNSLAWALMKDEQYESLRDFALDWQPYDPRNPMVYEYLGIAYDALGEDDLALRSFATIAEISPGDSGLLNRAGFLAFRAGEYAMAETLFRFAVERRPEHQNNYRGLALTLWARGRYEAAVEVLEGALGRSYNGRYKDVKRILREEAAQILQAWEKDSPKAAGEIQAWARKLGIDLSERFDLRVTLHWETDANDVDLHVVDPRNEESFYSHRRTATGVHLYEDLTQGLGPECTVVPAGRKVDGAYHVGVKYFAAGPMGVSRGIVVIQRPSEDGEPDVSVFPFTLLPSLEGNNQDMRHVALEE